MGWQSANVSRTVPRLGSGDYSEGPANSGRGYLGAVQLELGLGSTEVQEHVWTRMEDME